MSEGKGDFLTVERIAEQLGMSPDWVYEQLSPKGTLRSYRLGAARRVRISDFEAWLAEHAEWDESGSVVQLRGA